MDNLLDEILLTINCKICALLGIRDIYGLVSNRCNPCPENQTQNRELNKAK